MGIAVKAVFMFLEKRGVIMDKSDDEYQLVPHARIKELEQQVKQLKADPLGNSISGSSIKESMDNLSRSMSDMVGLFKDAADSMKLEEKEADVVSRKIDPLSEKIDTLIEQNKKIAKGILAVADMVQEFIEKQKKEEGEKVLPRGPNPPMFQQQKFAVPPQPEPMKQFNPSMPPAQGQFNPRPPMPGSLSANIPPPPGGLMQPKKKGFFG